MSEAAAKRRQGWREVMGNLRQRKVLAMLLLGFSSGLPIYLVGNTLGFWMRKEGIELDTIGFLSWVGLAYSMKFLWAPIVDKTDVPVLGRVFGRRRGWMLLSQLFAGLALVGMALVQPNTPAPSAARPQHPPASPAPALRQTASPPPQPLDGLNLTFPVHSQGETRPTGLLKRLASRVPGQPDAPPHPVRPS